MNLPDGSGLDLLRQIRLEGNATPVILLTANDLELDEVTGLEAGADDYITKPFSLAILRARVNAQLRRSAPGASQTLTMGPFAFNFEQMDFRRDGRAVELSKTEQKLLRVLLENRGHAVSRATLVDRVWTDGAEFVEENALSVTVKRLRSKLEADPSRPGISENGVRHRLHLGGEVMTKYLVIGAVLLLALTVVIYDRWRTAVP